MTPEEEGLVRAILADPWDRLARLAYADWLDEQGNADLAGLSRAGPGERATYRERIEARMRADAPTTFTLALTAEGLPAVSVPADSLRPAALGRGVASWLRWHHVVEMRPTGKVKDWRGLLRGEWLTGVPCLALGHPFNALPALAASPHLPGLLSLSFGADTPRGDALATFFRQAGPGRLCRLARHGGNFPLDAMQALAESPLLAGLRSLDAGFPDDGSASLLLGSPAFNGLVTLALMRGGNAGARRVAAARGLAALRNLDLYRSAYSDEGIDALASSPLVARLRRLRLDLLGYETAGAMERLARALPAGCTLALGGGARHREALAPILGERLEIAEGPP